MIENTRRTIHNRMRWIHAWLLEHADSGDHRGGSDEGCACTGMHEEMKDLWLKLNPHATVVWPRAGPYFGGGMAVSDVDEAGKIQKMLREIHDDDYQFLKQTNDD